jgi:hypothetical protein
MQSHRKLNRVTGPPTSRFSSVYCRRWLLIARRNTVPTRGLRNIKASILGKGHVASAAPALLETGAAAKLPRGAGRGIGVLTTLTALRCRIFEDGNSLQSFRGLDAIVGERHLALWASAWHSLACWRYSETLLMPGLHTSRRNASVRELFAFTGIAPPRLSGRRSQTDVRRGRVPGLLLTQLWGAPCKRTASSRMLLSAVAPDAL